MTTASIALQTLLVGTGDRSAAIRRPLVTPRSVPHPEVARRRAIRGVNLAASVVITVALVVAILPAARLARVDTAAMPWILAIATTGALAAAGCRQAWRLHGQVAVLRRDLAAARETERWHRAVVDEVVDGVLVASPEGRLVEVNQAACVLLGRTRDRLAGQRMWDLIPADDRLIALRRNEPLGTNGGGLRRLLRPDGTAVLADVSWSALPDGRVVYLAREWSGRR